MQGILNVVLVEDDNSICQRFSDYIYSVQDVKLVGVTNNSIQALEYIKDYQPHAIILDLELHMGGGNGLDVLKGLSEIGLTFKPYVLVTTNNSSSVTYELARTLGADFIMYKYQQDYSEHSIVEFLRMSAPVIKSNINTSVNNQQPIEETGERDKRILRRVMSELNNVGINPKVVGYQYLTQGIVLIINDEKHKISSVIGKKYNKTDTSIERAMQNAINRAWRTSDIDDLLKYYKAKIDPDKGIPTLTEFIFHYAYKIKIEY